MWWAFLKTESESDSSSVSWGWEEGAFLASENLPTVAHLLVFSVAASLVSKNYRQHLASLHGSFSLISAVCVDSVWERMLAVSGAFISKFLPWLGNIFAHVTKPHIFKFFLTFNQEIAVIKTFMLDSTQVECVLNIFYYWFNLYELASDIS